MRKNALLLAAICWTILVFVLCVVSFRSFPDVGVKSADKAVHILFHLGFTILWCLYFMTSNSVQSTIKIILGVVCASLLFGMAIELIQEYFTRSRQADAKDILANFSGAIVGALLIFGYAKLQKKA